MKSPNTPFTDKEEPACTLLFHGKAPSQAWKLEIHAICEASSQGMKDGVPGSALTLWEWLGELDEKGERKVCALYSCVAMGDTSDAC